MNAQRLPYAAQPTAGHETHGQTAIYSEADGRTVAIVYDGKAHAEFIVRACNAHDELVAALEGMVRQFGEDANFPAIQTARAALAKAQGGGDEPDDRCTDPAGHDWAVNEDSDRCYCLNCGADGDA